jgi:hypothetical protein
LKKLEKFLLNKVIGSLEKKLYFSYDYPTANRDKMDIRDLWQDHVEKLTKHTQKLTMQVESLENRIHYLEGIVVTLLVALKEGGVIVDSDETVEEKTYEF